MGAPQALSEKMNTEGLLVFYREDMRIMFENHIPYLLAGNRSSMITIEPADAHKFEYDLAGLLLNYSLPAHLHWLVMRINDMNSPMEYTADKLTLLIPDPAVVDRLVEVQNSIHTLV